MWYMFVRNIDGKKSKEKHWILSFIERNTAAYFDSFGIEYISQKMLNKNIDQSITRNMFIIQSDDSFMCLLYCIASLEYILWAKTVLHDTDSFYLNDYKKNDKIPCKHFKDNYVKSWI